VKNRGPWLVLLTYLLFGVLPIYWKFLTGVNAYFILCNRVVWSLVFALILLALWRHLDQVGRALRDRKLCLTLTVSGALLVLNWGSYIVAINTHHVIDASLAYYLNPIMSIFIGSLVFREPLTGLQKLSVAVAALGVGYAIVSYHMIPWLALIIGGSFAVYGAVKKTVRVDGMTSLGMETLFMLVPALVFAAFLIAGGHTGGADQALTMREWLLLPTTGIVTALPMIIYSQGIRTTSYSLAGMLMYINPTMQLACGIFVFGEAFTRVYAVMFVFVWAAVILYLLSGWLTLRAQNRTQAR
jgi:chloramphenicol-sensitive protein RarD